LVASVRVGETGEQRADSPATLRNAVANVELRTAAALAARRQASSCSRTAWLRLAIWG